MGTDGSGGSPPGCPGGRTLAEPGRGLLNSQPLHRHPGYLRGSATTTKPTLGKRIRSAGASCPPRALHSGSNTIRGQSWRMQRFPAASEPCLPATAAHLRYHGLAHLCQLPNTAQGLPLVEDSLTTSPRSYRFRSR